MKEILLAFQDGYNHIYSTSSENGYKDELAIAFEMGQELGEQKEEISSIKKEISEIHEFLKESSRPPMRRCF